MICPNYIQKELKKIDGTYFAVFNPCVKGGMSNGKGRWEVRKWIGVHPKRLDLWDTDMSEVIMVICKEEMTDEGLIDAGYEDVDRRIITAIGKSHYWKLDYKKKIADLDWHNEKMEREANSELEYQSKYVAKRVWRGLHEPTVHLSGKEWKV